MKDDYIDELENLAKQIIQKGRTYEYDLLNNDSPQDLHDLTWEVFHMIEKWHEGAKNTEQQVQPDNLPEDGDSDYYDDHGTGK